MVVELWSSASHHIEEEEKEVGTTTA